MARLLMMFVLLSSLSACGGASKYMSDEEERETRARSKVLIQALEAYHQDHGAYPATLSLLVPDYLPHMITTAMGTDFQYRWSEEGDYYVLSIREAGCDYSSYPAFSPGYKGELLCSGV